MYGERNMMGVVLGEDDEEKWQYLTSAVVTSEMSKLTYSTWLRYFGEGEGS